MKIILIHQTRQSLLQASMKTIINDDSNCDRNNSNSANNNSRSSNSNSISDKNNRNITINSKSCQNESEFDAEKIVAHRGNLNSTSKPLKFKVRWLGFKYDHDTWEPLVNVKNCKAFYEYVDSHPNLWHLYTPNDPNFPVLTNNKSSTSSCQSKLTEASAINIAAAMMATNSNPNHESVGISNSESFGYACAAGSIDSEGNVLKYRKCIQDVDKENWLQAAHEELVRLVSVRNTMNFIKKSQIPKDRLVSYYNPRCNRKWKNGVNIF
jgi:hypothetical protein